MRTQQLVRKCFGSKSFMLGSWQVYARAARRFVRLENQAKARQLVQADEAKIAKDKQVKLPESWGKFRSF